MKLYIVPTPIGNLDDITFRAVKILREADIILAEDTRKTVILLKHYDIHTRLESYHKFNEHRITERIVERISEGRTVALVSDAGTPGISDPGFLLVRNCIEKGIAVECLPGATALIPALIDSGLPCDRFCFEGFLPQKKGRQKKLAQLIDEERTMVFYESPYRTLKCLEQMADLFGEDRKVSISRELSKIYEETVRGTLSEAIAHFKTVEPKGEIVIVMEGKNLTPKSSIHSIQ
ncbi:MAG: 16S rRNA (cytidine(1402)-2'-O)-methyltransferase [Prevotellaceae bacterium]|jgi:16S rRNA (cytidine1402-2'-O)-methyltransferase|nr:16S rRNA (cytidine(1402)-2'-O)-methyltransferase [Prevotellaceae bacterium]